MSEEKDKNIKDAGGTIQIEELFCAIGELYMANRKMGQKNMLLAQEIARAGEKKSDE